MTQMNKSEINELLSAYIDDELVERQQNEVKRLIQNDEKIAQQLMQLRKQKELLSALPIVSAPQEMISRIKASVKTQRILEEQTTGKTKAPAVTVGQKELFGRRLITIAAMLLIPVGILAWVVFTIVKPVSETGVTLPTVAKVVESPPEVLAVSFPLSATLHLNTSQTTTMKDFINKAIYRNSLVNYTRSDSDNGAATTYAINGNRQRIFALLGELTTVWDKCDTTAMTVHGRTVSVNVAIEDITPDQVLALYEADVFTDPLKLAKDFDRMNRFIQSMPDYGVGSAISNRNYIAMTPVMPVKPQLTSPQKLHDDNEQSDQAQNVTLFIAISSQ